MLSDRKDVNLCRIILSYALWNEQYTAWYWFCEFKLAQKRNLPKKQREWSQERTRSRGVYLEKDEVRLRKSWERDRTFRKTKKSFASGSLTEFSGGYGDNLLFLEAQALILAGFNETLRWNLPPTSRRWQGALEMRTTGENPENCHFDTTGVCNSADNIEFCQLHVLFGRLAPDFLHVASVASVFPSGRKRMENQTCGERAAGVPERLRTPSIGVRK